MISMRFSTPRAFPPPFHSVQTYRLAESSLLPSQKCSAFKDQICHPGRLRPEELHIDVEIESTKRPLQFIRLGPHPVVEPHGKNRLHRVWFLLPEYDPRSLYTGPPDTEDQTRSGNLSPDRLLPIVPVHLSKLIVTGRPVPAWHDYRPPHHNCL